jgi:hypothetical protein
LRLLPILLLFAAAGCRSPESRLQQTLNRASGTVQLPPGVTEISTGLKLPDGAHDLEITGGAGSVLRASNTFRGRALLSCAHCQRIRLRNFALDGNRGGLARTVEMAPSENAFRIFYADNGLLFDQTQSLDISHLTFGRITNFAIVVSRSSDIRIADVQVSDSGSRNRKQRNNTTGGIVIEEGSAHFQVRNCILRNIFGNGVWTHSLYTSPRDSDGVIEGNRFDTIGRDAIQVGHATGIRVEGNTGAHIGYPADTVDRENEGFPVAVDTAGDVDNSAYANNRFEEIDGKCFDLDGFHDGEVRANTCTNKGPAQDYPFGHFALVMNDSNPNMHSRRVHIADNEFNGAKYGGIYVIGSDHIIERNRLLNLDLAHCDACYIVKNQPGLLETGIYLALGTKPGDPTAHNVIRDNQISGYKMRTRCIAAAQSVSLAANTIRDNRCNDVQ